MWWALRKDNFERLGGFGAVAPCPVFGSGADGGSDLSISMCGFVQLLILLFVSSIRRWSLGACCDVLGLLGAKAPMENTTPPSPRLSRELLIAVVVPPIGNFFGPLVVMCSTSSGRRW